MRRVLFDADVILDVLLAREPHVADSVAALDLAATGSIEGYLAGHTVTTLAYLIQRHGTADPRLLLTDLLSKLRVAPIGDSTVRLALASHLRDFEDAVTVAAAMEAGIELIVTRNTRDFAASAITAVLPAVFVAEERTRFAGSS